MLCRPAKATGAAKRSAKAAAKNLSNALIEIKETVPKSREELVTVIRNPGTRFTATLLSGAVLVLMEMSGFGIFIVLAWVLANLILNPLAGSLFHW